MQTTAYEENPQIVIFYILSTEQQITDVRKEITECKEELQQAKVIRKNRQGLSFLLQ